MFKKIVFASDGSAHSLRAGNKAFELASLSPGSKVYIVYVIDKSHAKDDILHNWGRSVSEMRKEKLEIVEQKAKHFNVEYELLFLQGEPGPTIVNYVNDQNADLVVIGSRGLNTLQEMVLGSVSHKVAKRAHCPVLIVK